MRSHQDKPFHLSPSEQYNYSKTVLSWVNELNDKFQEQRNLRDVAEEGGAGVAGRGTRRVVVLDCNTNRERG